MVLNLLLIGLVVSLDPLPLTAFVVILPSKRGVRKGAAYLFGWLVSLAIVVTVTVLATGNNPPKPNTVPSLASLAVKIAIGTVLVVIAIRQRRRMRGPKKPKKPPKWQELRGQHVAVVRLGLAPDAPALDPDRRGSGHRRGGQAVQLGELSRADGFCVLGSASYIAMEIYAGFRPDQSQAFLARFRAWVETRTDRAIVVGCLLLGLWLIASSIYYVSRVLERATRPASPRQRGRDHDVVPGRHGDHAARVAARRTITPASAVRVSRSPPRQPSAAIVARSATRPEASIRPNP